jgi:hypothetical protein
VGAVVAGLCACSSSSSNGPSHDAGFPQDAANVVDASKAADASTADASTSDASTADVSAEASLDGTAPSDATTPADANAGADAAGDAAARSDASFGPTANLLLNGDAESGTGSPDGTTIETVPDWVVTGEANVVLYGATNGYPAPSDPGASDRGLNFFAGGPNDDVSTFTQSVDLSPYASVVASGATVFISGYLGGYSTQEDNAVLNVSFLGAGDGGPVDGGDGGAPVLGTASIGPVTSADRGGATAFVYRSTTASVPQGTVSLQVQLVMTRLEGTANDGYADDLSVTLSGN